MKPLIGITSGQIKDRDHPWTPLVYGHCRTYPDAVLAAGGIPVLLDITEDPGYAAEVCQRLDGVLISGGIDLDPSSYGAQKSDRVKELSKRQDEFELKLLEEVMKSRKPILAICRGMQLLNIAHGGDLYQDIEAELPNAQDHRESQRTGNITKLVHTLRVENDSKLAAIVGTTSIGVNSHHHQAVKRLGKGLKETAWAEDGILEGLEVVDYPFAVGVQFHPEEIVDTEKRWRHLFEAFVKEAGSQNAIYSPVPRLEPTSEDLVR